MGCTPKNVAVVGRWPLGKIRLYLSLKITGTHSHRLCPVWLSEIGQFFSVYLSGFVVSGEHCKKLKFFVGLNWKRIFMNWKMSHCKSWTPMKRSARGVENSFAVLRVIVLNSESNERHLKITLVKVLLNWPVVFPISGSRLVGKEKNMIFLENQVPEEQANEF